MIPGIVLFHDFFHSILPYEISRAIEFKVLARYASATM
jgi:hypothetical protein